MGFFFAIEFFHAIELFFFMSRVLIPQRCGNRDFLKVLWLGKIFDRVAVRSRSVAGTAFFLIGFF
jgi:hypothetical protein